MWQIMSHSLFPKCRLRTVVEATYPASKECDYMLKYFDDVEAADRNGSAEIIKGTANHDENSGRAIQSIVVCYRELTQVRVLLDEALNEDIEHLKRRREALDKASSDLCAVLERAMEQERAKARSCLEETTRERESAKRRLDHRESMARARLNALSPNKPADELPLDHKDGKLESASSTTAFGGTTERFSMAPRRDLCDVSEQESPSFDGCSAALEVREIPKERSSSSEKLDTAHKKVVVGLSDTRPLTSVGPQRPVSRGKLLGYPEKSQSLATSYTESASQQTKASICVQDSLTENKHNQPVIQDLKKNSSQRQSSSNSSPLIRNQIPHREQHSSPVKPPFAPLALRSLPDRIQSNGTQRPLNPHHLHSELAYNPSDPRYKGKDQTISSPNRHHSSTFDSINTAFSHASTASAKQTHLATPCSNHRDKSARNESDGIKRTDQTPLKRPVPEQRSSNEGPKKEVESPRKRVRLTMQYNESLDSQVGVKADANANVDTDADASAGTNEVMGRTGTDGDAENVVAMRRKYKWGGDRYRPRYFDGNG